MERAFRGMDLSKHFIVNFQLIRTEGWTSGPDSIITIGITIRVAVKVRVIIVSCVVCNVDIMTPSKGWTIAIVAVCCILIAVVHVIFKVTISVVVFQRVYGGVARVIVWIRRPWKETYYNQKLQNKSWVLTITKTLHTDNRNNNNLILKKESPMCTSSTPTLKLQLDDHEVAKRGRWDYSHACPVQST